MANRGSMGQYSDIFNNMDHHYECLLGTMPGIVYTLDEKGHFTYLSDCTSELLGFSREDLLGRHFSYLVHPGDIPAVSRDYLLPHFEGVPTGGERAPKLFDERRSFARRTNALTVRLRKKEGSVASGSTLIKCKVNASGQYGKDNRFCGTLGFIYDAKEEEQKAFSLDAKRSYDAFELLAHALTHVFSNVFTGIYGNLQLIEMQLDKPEEFSGNIEAIKHSIENAVSLIKKLSKTIVVNEHKKSFLLPSIITDEAETLLSDLETTCTYNGCSALRTPEVNSDYMRHILRAVYYHISRSIVPKNTLTITAVNCTEAPVQLPRVDCAYIHLQFSYPALAEPSEETAIERFSTMERIASMSLSYELLKKAGGQIIVGAQADRCIIDLYLPALG